MKKPAKDASVRVAGGKNVRKRKGTPPQASGKQVRLEKSRDKAAPSEVIAPNSSARLRAMIEASVDCVITIDAHSTILEFNAAAEQTFGYRRDDVIGKPLTEAIIPPSLREAHRRRMAVLLKGGTSKLLGNRVEMPAMRSDGSEFPVELTVTQIVGQTPSIFTAYLRDITDRIQAEEALNAQALRYKTLMETSTDSIYVLNEKGDLQGANAAFLRRRGYSAAEVKGLNVADWDARWTREQLQEKMRKLVGSSAVFETRHRCKDGSVFDVEVCSTSVRIGGEQLFFCVTRDITERKQAEQALRESEERFRALYNDVPSMYFTLNAAGTVLSVNEFGAAYLGYEPSELIGQPVQRIFVEADRAATGEHIAETLADPSRVFDWVLRKICKDGRIVWVRETARAVRSRDGELAVLINCADITKQRESEDALRRSERRFATFMDNLPGFAWMKDVKGRFVYRNKAMREIPGFRENWNGKSDADFWPPEVAAQYRASDLKVITSRAPLQTVASYPGDDRDRCVLASKFPIFDQAGAVTMVAGVSFEVTERIQTEQARAQLAAIVESSNDAIIGRTFEDIITSWNAAAEKVYGYSAAEILGRSIALLRPPEIPDLMSTMIPRLKRGERIDNFEEIRVRKDGSRVHGSVSLSPIKSPTGEIAGISEISRDITERKMIEKALESAEEQYRSIFNNAVDGIFRTSPDGTFLVANPAAARIFGFASPEELTEERRDIAQQCYVDPRRRDEFKRLLLEQGVVNGFEYEAYRKDGSRVWISENTRAVHSSSGEILYFEGIFEDVTDRKRTEEALQMMRFCVDHAGDGVAWVSPEGRLLYVNESTCERLGYSESELLGLKIFDLDPDYQPGVWATHWEELKRRGTITLETRHRTKAGRVFPIEVNANYVCAGGQEFNFAFTRDITQRKQAEEKLWQSLQLLRAITEGTTDAIFAKDREGRYLMINTVGARFIGKTPEQVIGLDDSQIFSGETLARIIERDQAIMTTGETRTDEDITTTPAGISRVHLTTKGPLRDSSGAIIGLFGVSRDITERKREEGKLRESEARFRLMFEKSGVGMALTTVGSIILQANAAFCALIGRTEEEVIGHSAAEFTHPEDVAKTLKPDTEVREDGVHVMDLEKRYLRKDGATLWGHVTAVLHFDENAQPLYYIAIVEDITDRKQAEQKILAQLDELRRWQEVTLGREDRVLELKREINKLRQRLGEPARYASET